MTWSIVTPDGVTYNLPAVAMDEVTGLGMPPLEHLSHIVPQQDGARLDAIYARPRIVTMRLGFSDTDSMADMHTLVAAFDDAIRYDRMGAAQPCELQYTEGGNTRTLYAYILDYTDNYAGYCAEIAVRFICYDPFVYDDSDITEIMSGSQRLSLNYLAGKVGGTWSALGSPAFTAVGGFTRVLAAVQNDSYVYFSGLFLNANGDANGDGIIRYNKAAGTYTALGSGISSAPAPSIMQCMALAPDGTLYWGGGNATIGGVAANYIAKWNGTAWSALGAGMGPAGGGFVYGVAVAQDGTLYAAGAFTTAGGVAASGIAKWNGTAWSALGTGLTGATSLGYCLAVGLDGSIYVGGDFTTANGVTCANIARWNGTTFTPLGSGLNGLPRAMYVAPDGTLYVAGSFTTAGGASANYIAKWDGANWSPLGTGLNNAVYALSMTSDGMLYVGGSFSTAGGIALADKLATWNGYTWAQPDINLPGAPQLYTITASGNDVYLGFDTSGSTTLSAAATAIENTGTVKTFPVITIYGPGTLSTLKNETTGDELLFNMAIAKGEVITIDLSENAKTITNNLGTSRLADLYPQSDIATWALAPDPEAASGNNIISVYITGQPLEYNDGSNQLTYYELVTGLTLGNTNAGRLYFSIIADGGGFYHVGIYEDAARTLLVAHTATYNSTGSKALVADNSSGIGGAIYVSAVVGADADIYADYALVVFEYTNRYWTMHQAVG